MNAHEQEYRPSQQYCKSVGQGLRAHGLLAYLRGVIAALLILPAFAAATVSGVTATTGYYKAAQAIAITVTFSEAVTVVGAPLLALNITGAPTATCAAVTSSLTMTCSYTVAAGANVATLDYAATSSLTLPSGATITTVSNSSAATLTLPTPGAAGSLAISLVTVDTTAPTLPAASIQADNQARPNTLTLVFSEALTNNAALTTPATYAVRNNAGTITYSIASVTRVSATTVRLSLASADQANTATYFTNADIAAHLVVTPATGLTDLAANAVAATAVTEASASPAAVTDSTVPTLSGVLEYVDTTRVKLVFSEKMTKAKAETLSNYTLSGTGTVASLSGSPTAAVLAANGTDVTLTLPALTTLRSGDRVMVTAGTNHQDLAGNSLAATTATVLVLQMPAAISFTARVNVASKTLFASSAVTVSGLNAPAPIAVTANSDASLTCAIAPAATGVFGAFAACNPSTPLLVFNGDQIKLQLMSSASALTSVTGGISIESVTGSFQVTTAPTVTLLGNITFAALTSVAAAVNNPDAAIFVSVNGVLVIPASVTSASLLGAVPLNTAVSVASGANVQFSVNGISLNIKPVGGDAILLTKSYTVDGVTGIQLLELVSGRVTVSYSGAAGPLQSVQLGSGSTAKQVLISSESTTPATFDLQVLSDGRATLAVTGGRINLRLASGASVVALADTPTTLYANEVASLSSAGKVSQIRVGSLTGVVNNTPGDALLLTLPNNVISRMKVPNMGRPHDRLDPNVSMLQSLFDFVGSRTVVSQTTQGAHGQLPLLFNNIPLFVIPYGDVLVDTTRPDGVTLANDGHYEVSRKGVYVKLTTTVSSLIHLASAVQTTFSATVSINDDGAFEINKGGQTVLVKPDITSQATAGNTISVRVTSEGRLVLQTIGREQPLLPRFFDLAQIAKTFEALDPKMILVDNLDGSVSATVKGATMRLFPEYEILSPFGGIPVEYRNSPFWIDARTGIIYFKYPTGSAQGFRVQ